MCGQGGADRTGAVASVVPGGVRPCCDDHGGGVLEVLYRRFPAFITFRSGQIRVLRSFVSGLAYSLYPMNCPIKTLVRDCHKGIAWGAEDSIATEGVVSGCQIGGQSGLTGMLSRRGSRLPIVQGRDALLLRLPLFCCVFHE